MRLNRMLTGHFAYWTVRLQNFTYALMQLYIVQQELRDHYRYGRQRHWKMFLDQRYWPNCCKVIVPSDGRRAARSVHTSVLAPRVPYCSSDTPTLIEMFDDDDEQLFTCSLPHEIHVLQSYLPERTRPQYNLRTITHNKELIAKTSDLNKRDFIVGMSYKNCYWESLI